MTGADLADALVRMAELVRLSGRVNGLDVEVLPGARLSVVSAATERTRKHRTSGKLDTDRVTEPLQKAFPKRSQSVTEALQQDTDPPFPPHTPPIPETEPKQSESKLFPDPEVCLSDCLPEKLTGRARVAAKTAKRPKSPQWRRVPEDWNPQDSHVALARSESVTFDRELLKFRSHEFGRPHSDADATFTKWLLEAGERQRTSRNGYQKPPGLMEHERRPEARTFRREPSEPQQIDLQATLAGVSQARAAMQGKQ